MKHPDYNSPSELKTFLEENNMAMQKKFGQNFLINENARVKIIDTLDPKEDEYIWEIGPGLGCMTELILQRGSRLTCFEIDKGFIRLLHSFFQDYENNEHFKIVDGDVLKNWKKEFDLVKNTEKKPAKLFGNLPYNIAATFVADTIAKGLVFERCVFTVQKEVAQRMASKPRTENYSGFSVLCQFLYDVKLCNELGGSNFWPKPNVASQTVLMEKKKVPLECKDPQTFVKVVHALFSSRRKTISNNIKSILPPNVSVEEYFALTKIDSKRRAEELTVQEFIELSDALYSVLNK